MATKCRSKDESFEFSAYLTGREASTAQERVQRTESRKFPQALLCVLYPCSGLVCRYLMLCCLWFSQSKRASLTFPFPEEGLGLTMDVSDTSSTLNSSDPDEYDEHNIWNPVLELLVSRAQWRIHGSAV